MGLTLWYLCQIILIDISSNTMINTKLILAGVLVTIFLLSFDSVESACNCEGPVVDHCCPVGFNGNCCEFPLRRSENRLDEHSPLALKLKKEAQAVKKDVAMQKKIDPRKCKGYCKQHGCFCVDDRQCCFKKCRKMRGDRIKTCRGI